MVVPVVIVRQGSHARAEHVSVQAPVRQRAMAWPVAVTDVVAPVATVHLASLVPLRLAFAEVLRPASLPAME